MKSYDAEINGHFISVNKFQPEGDFTKYVVTDCYPDICTEIYREDFDKEGDAFMAFNRRCKEIA